MGSRGNKRLVTRIPGTGQTKYLSDYEASAVNRGYRNLLAKVTDDIMALNDTNYANKNDFKKALEDLDYIILRDSVRADKLLVRDDMDPDEGEYEVRINRNGGKWGVTSVKKAKGV